jgi:hypothetical protein
LAQKIAMLRGWKQIDAPPQNETAGTFGNFSTLVFPPHRNLPNHPTQFETIKIANQNAAPRAKPMASPFLFPAQELA